MTFAGKCAIVQDMKKPEILAARNMNNRAEQSLPASVIPVNTGNAVLDANLYDLSRRFCGNHSPDEVLFLDSVERVWRALARMIADWNVI